MEIGKMAQRRCKCLPLMLLTGLFLGFPPVLWGTQWQPFPVLAGPDNQEAPDVSGTMVVWHEFVEQYGDYDIYVADVNDPGAPETFIIGDANDQMYPVVYDNIVIWQDYIVSQGAEDWDVHFADTTDFNNLQVYAAGNEIGVDETQPAIHGSIISWQSLIGDDTDINGADISDPLSPFRFPVASFEFDQQTPAVHRTHVIWQDNFFGDWDIYLADIWQKNKPTEVAVAAFEADQSNPAISGANLVYQDNYFGDWDVYVSDISDPQNPIETLIAATEADQKHPDIDGNIVVWQDNRNGNWDIFGYNLTTRLEFQITDDAADQTNPAISGNLLVWQDNRDGPWNIYAVVLDGPETARCLTRPAGDLNDDCITNFADLALMSVGWLECGLDQAQICGQ